MFKFRLEKLLTYRRVLEDNARQGVADAKAACRACEDDLGAIQLRKSALGKSSPGSVQERIELGLRFAKADDEAGAASRLLELLRQEEEGALTRWIEARMQVQLVEKLREKAAESWNAEQARKAQNELDEWAVMRPAVKR